MNEVIDVVIAWVDGSDKEWQAEKNKYSGKTDKSNSNSRYRNWNNLQYWFRSVEQNMPWINKIHFVTWGHIPLWLKINHPKLHIVHHEDYIPLKYLPTFSSHTIELNFHRIKELANQFIYFNDDMFVNRPLKPEHFFRNGLPCDTAALNIHCYALSRPIQLISIIDTGVINEHFEYKQSLKKNILKWFYPRYGSKLLRTIALFRSPRFPGFYISHTPQAFLKSTFEEVWEAEREVLDETCSHKFRNMTDVNQWLMKEWQIAKGQFYPRAASFSKVFHLGSINRQKLAEKAAKCITEHKTPLICINDSDMELSDFEYCKKIVNQAFEREYSKKSSFEV